MKQLIRMLGFYVDGLAVSVIAAICACIMHVSQ